MNLYFAVKFILINKMLVIPTIILMQRERFSFKKNDIIVEVRSVVVTTNELKYPQEVRKLCRKRVFYLLSLKRYKIITTPYNRRSVFVSSIFPIRTMAIDYFTPFSLVACSILRVSASIVSGSLSLCCILHLPKFVLPIIQIFFDNTLRQIPARIIKLQPPGSPI